MIHPLFDFAHFRVDAPFSADLKRHSRPGVVLPAQNKTGLVAARTGPMAHLDAGMAVMFEDGKARFGARYQCGGESVDAVVLADARAYGNEICDMCVCIMLGPAVYRCFNAAKQLIYIGSSKNQIQRQNIHGTQTPWWFEVAEVTIQRYPTLLEARIAERLAIRNEQPLYNVRHKSRPKNREQKTA